MIIDWSRLLPSIRDKNVPEWLSETEPIAYRSEYVSDSEPREIPASLTGKATATIRWVSAQVRREKRARPQFHFGIVTPVFDAALPSLHLLWHDLRSQHHANWTWMLCSNGYSKDIDDFVQHKHGFSNRGRQVEYNYVEPEPTNTPESLLANIGKRRDFCLKALDADFVFTIDADAKILDREMFSAIDSELNRTQKKLCIYKILCDASPTNVLPIFPITFARIDALNFCIDAKVAKQVGYPSDVSPTLFGNEFRYLYGAYRICNRDYLFINRIFAKWNGNRRYENLLKLRVQH